MSDTGTVRRLWAIVFLASALAGCARGGEAAPAPTGQAYHGIELAPVPDRPSFVLRDTEGNRFDFREQTAGRPTFVYFGYTNCPDECPTAMADLAAALRKTDPAVRDKVRVVFVSADAKRDTGAAVRRFLDQWSTSFIGLVGTQEELDDAARASGVPPGSVGPEPKTLPGRPNEHEHEPGTAPHEHFGPLGYSVGHSAVIYAYDADDRLPVVYPGGVTPSEIAADLPALAGS